MAQNYRRHTPPGSRILAPVLIMRPAYAALHSSADCEFLGYKVDLSQYLWLGLERCQKRRVGAGQNWHRHVWIEGFLIDNQWLVPRTTRPCRATISLPTRKCIGSAPPKFLQLVKLQRGPASSIIKEPPNKSQDA